MSFSPKVSRWKNAVASQLSARKVPLPINLILSVIAVESAGNPGLVNPKSGAMGLMQIMPVVLSDFNKARGKNYSPADMTGESFEAASRQIEVGLWVLSSFWKSAYQYLTNRLSTVPVDELGRIADLFYVAGPGATKKRLDKLETPTWQAVQDRYPTWNALPHPRRVFKHVDEEPTEWNHAAIEKWLSGPLGTAVKGFAGGALILIVAWLLMARKGF